MKYLSLTDEVLETTLEAGEFPNEVRNAGEKVVVILTQDWCHDWHDMQAFLPEFEGQAVFFLLEYNRHPAFERLMGFKEEVFDNREIPYLRYYYRGEFIVATNQLPRGTFQALLTKTKPFALR